MNLDRAREIARLALRNLEANQQRIDDLNVYPVPDGDTGTNLTLTVRAIVDALEKSNADGHEAVARELSRAALMGARGNSGVIFSQIVRGFADVLGEHDPIDETMIARAFRSASDAAYRAVRRPVEGTMLTVIREMAEAAESPDARGLDRVELLSLIVARGEESLARTPELLAVLKEAGVVDAGGAGLLEIIRGVRAAVAGEPAPEAPAEPVALSVEAMHQELSEYRYCTVFVIEGDGLDADGLERDLERARRLAARRRRLERAQGARPHRRSRRGAEPRHGERDDRRGRDRRHAPADARTRGAPRRRSARGPADARDGDRRRRSRGRKSSTVQEPAGNPRDRGWADDEPVDRGDRGRRRRDPGDRGDRAAEQLQRDPQRRAGDRARQQADAGRADALRAGGPRGDDRLRPRARRRRERDARWCARSKASRRARSRSPRAT